MKDSLFDHLWKVSSDFETRYQIPKIDLDTILILSQMNTLLVLRMKASTKTIPKLHTQVFDVNGW